MTAPGFLLFSTKRFRLLHCFLELLEVTVLPSQGIMQVFLQDEFPHHVPYAFFELAQTRSFVLSSQTLEKQAFQELRDLHFFEVAFSDLFEEVALLMCGGVRMEQQHNNNGQAVYIRAVIILLARCLLRRTEQLGPNTRAMFILSLCHFLKRVDMLIFDRCLPVLDPLGQPKIYEFAVAIDPDHNVMQFDIPMDVSLGMQVVESIHHVQRYLVILKDFLGLEVSLFAVQTASVHEGLQVHLAQFSQYIQPDFLVVLQG